MNYLSVCSGIEAATVAWHPLGWNAVAYSEIEKFPSQVLAHHYPQTPNLGDMTKFKEWNINDAIDLIVGGTPCQAFSVAGLRKGLADPRGNLTLTYLAMVEHFRPRWLVWENVPGVLSDKSGAFGSLLGGLGELGYGWAYRVLDAQFFGVAQRRRRVFVVGYAGAWQRAAAVLFEPESLRGDSAQSRKAKQNTSDATGACAQVGCETAPTLKRDYGKGYGDGDMDGGGLIAHSLRGEGFDASEDGTGRGVPLWPCSVAPALTASFGDKQGLDDQNALNGGGFVSSEMPNSQEPAKRLLNRESDTMQPIGQLVSSN